MSRINLLQWIQRHEVPLSVDRTNLEGLQVIDLSSAKRAVDRNVMEKQSVLPFMEQLPGGRSCLWLGMDHDDNPYDDQLSRDLRNEAKNGTMVCLEESL